MPQRKSPVEKSKTAKTAPRRPPMKSSDSAVITADFSKRVPNVKSMSGFLGSISETEPPDERIEPLRPAYIRLIKGYWQPDGSGATVDLPTIKRLTAMKTAMFITPGTPWKYNQRSDVPYKWQYHDYPAWEKCVRETARKVKGKGYDIIWDIQNEPDSTDLFWKGGTRQQFFETFVRAAKVLRDELGPKVTTSGPCLARYDPDFIGEFLDYCLTHGVSLPVLTWHELFVDDDIPSVTEHLHEARRRFVNNPAYARLGIKKILINEFVGPKVYYQPGEVLGYIKALELGGADGACRTTWGKDETGVENDRNTSLDGLLTAGSYQPRAVWWAYKHYADSVPSRVQSTSSDVRIVSFASRGGDAKDAPARVLIGYYAYKDSPNMMSVRLRFQGLKAVPALAKATKVRVKIDQIPNSGEASVPQLKTVAEDTLAVNKGAAESRPFNLVLHEAYVVTVSE